MGACQPVFFAVGWQIAESLRTKLSRQTARSRAVGLLHEVGIPDAGRRASAFAHQLSGGMCQRVKIAMTLGSPRLALHSPLDTLAPIATKFSETLMPLSRRQLIRSTSTSALLSAIGTGALAQAGALDSARIVTGFPPGGTSDTICRRVAERLKPGYAKTVVVENRSGAGGQIAIQHMKTQAADGTSLLQTPMSMLGIYPHIYKKLAYDPLADLTPASLGAVFDFGFAVGPAVPATVKNIGDFLTWCKANPMQANYGSPAAGSVPHFIGVLIGRAGGVDLKHIPYRGTQPAILEMMGGQLPAVSGPVGEFTQHVASGRCRVLATTGGQRNRFAPDVATLAEQGLRDLVFNEWFGFYLPGQAAGDVVQRANTALRAALAAPDVIDGLALMGLEARSSTPAELAAMLKADTERWGPIVKSIGFTADS
jgi:tripartite-type tricarboxylate transporter receptor subunit TctC